MIASSAPKRNPEPKRRALVSQQHHAHARLYLNPCTPRYWSGAALGKPPRRNHDDLQGASNAHLRLRTAKKAKKAKQARSDLKPSARSWPRAGRMGSRQIDELHNMARGLLLQQL